jgi:hypothetical protein
MTTDDDLDRATKRMILVRSLAYYGAAIIGVTSLLFLVVVGYFTFDSRDQLLDCTVPGNECYERGQANTAKVVGQIIDQQRKVVVIVTAVCAEEPEIRDEVDKRERIRLMEKCVNSYLKETKHG